MDRKPPDPGPGLIGPHGGYRSLKSYQMAEIVYDATIAFCNRFVFRLTASLKGAILPVRV